MKNLVCALLFAVVSLPSAAFGDWSAAFPVDAVGTYVPSQTTKVMVVSVGAPDAAAALTKALGGAAVVIPSSGLGDVAELSDADIVGKAAAQPIDQVVIVRTAGTSEAPIAVVTIYQKDGTAIGGYTASADSPAPPSDGGGASLSEMESANNESKAAAKPSAEAKEEFLERYVAFQDWVGVNQYGAVVSSWSTAFKGQYREPLPGRKFYEYIGEDELAEKYRKKATTKTIVSLVGVGGIVGGTVIMLAPLFGPVGSTDFNATPLLVGGGVMLAGTVVMMVGLTINPHPVEPSEARRLAVQFNRKLAKELGIDLENIDPQSSKSDPVIDSIDFAVIPTNGGGMVGVRGTF